MITREEILASPEYWFESLQNELYRQLVAYLEKEGINQTELAARLNVSKGYITQILSGNFNHTLKKLIELSLSVGLVPQITYTPIDEVIRKDCQQKELLKELDETENFNKSYTPEHQ
ncbi:helix-turn-helix domain-containing protein [Mucilaginibacter arboris]|uniref:Helix-turn-helix domain-containing protein n=1 Tax=Mucilaginibacter arboris TaxID=2682090 RepID=A0A7K1SZL4_9SPHI|nr:helix-turn-helix transcriptional regulator [Mucilaginibacter arboris]MVN22697.1 helix-turn-helix domain-containing protein [Mucilaginibacter arboris]